MIHNKFPNSIENISYGDNMTINIQDYPNLKSISL